MNAPHFSRYLGWFSIGLGLAELLAPRKVARAIGVGEQHDTLLRALGAREIASGLGILARPKPTGFVWSRVAGDVMDLTLLGVAYDSDARDTDRRRLTFAIAAVAGVTALDVLTAIRLSQPPRSDPRWRYEPESGRDGLRRPLEVQPSLAQLAATPKSSSFVQIH